MRKVDCISQRDVLKSFSDSDAKFAKWYPVLALIVGPIYLTYIGSFLMGVAVFAFFMSTTNDKISFLDPEKTKDGEYIVGQSFPNIRDNSKQLQRKQKKIQNWCIAGAACIVITVLQHISRHIFNMGDCILLIGLYQFWRCYTISKYEKTVIDLHSDITFEACENLESFVKMEIDETFEASCQSFSNNECNKDDYIFVLTSRSLFYALRKQDGWTSFRKPLSEVTKLGYAYGKDDECEYLCWQFVFSDDSLLFVKLKNVEGLSYPELMSKKILEVFDFSLSGDENRQRSNRRRRVESKPSTITQEETTAPANTASQQMPTAQKKVQLELSDVLIGELQNASSYEFSRNLEL